MLALLLTDDVVSRNWLIVLGSHLCAIIFMWRYYGSDLAASHGDHRQVDVFESIIVLTGGAFCMLVVVVLVMLAGTLAVELFVFLLLLWWLFSIVISHDSSRL